MKMAMQMKKEGGMGSQLEGNQGFNLGSGLGRVEGLNNFGGLGMSNPFGMGGFNNSFLEQNQVSPIMNTSNNNNLNNNQ